MQTIGVFKDPDAISCITGQFREAGLDHSALSLVVRDREEPGEPKPDAVVQVPKVVKGGLVGGLAGLVVGAATLLVPGIGLIVVGVRWRQRWARSSRRCQEPRPEQPLARR